MSQKIQDACYINYHLEVNYVKITIFTTNRLLQKHTPDHPLVTVTEDDDVWVRLLTWLEALCCRRWGAVCSLKDVLTMTWTWCDEVAWRSLQSMGCSPTPRLNWEPRMKIFHLAFLHNGVGIMHYKIRQKNGLDKTKKSRRTCRAISHPVVNYECGCVYLLSLPLGIAE